MNTGKKRLIAALCAVLMCFAVVGCASENTESQVYLNYGTGTNELGQYNQALYGLNGIGDAQCPDPGAFYVSEEEDAEYGGYFYRYHTSETTAIPKTAYYQDNFIQTMSAYCERSKDLYHWEPAGILAGGYSLAIDQFDWCKDTFWAPEVIRNPADGKYYMYFSATCKLDMGIDYLSNSSTYQDRIYIGVAVSDAPVGPFDLLGDIDAATGMLVPTINFQVGFGLDHSISAIDPHPYFDDDGQLYLYFVRQGCSYYSGGNQTAVMKMNTMAYPDYSSATILTMHGAASISAEAGDLLGAQMKEEYYIDEGGVNEGPFMYKHNGKYYLTYSAYGFGNPGYSVHQAIGDSPMGPFTKLDNQKGNPVLDGSIFGDVYGTGHHCLVTVGDELWIIYHRHTSVNDGMGWERPAAVDRIVFVKNEDGLEVMTGNGPSRILTWLPESISGYQNLTQSASIATDNGTGTQYLADGALAMYPVASKKTLSLDSGDVTITLKWDTPVSVSSLMVYNSASTDSAFSKISSVRFMLAEKPVWASQDYSWAVIEDVPLQSGAWDEVSEAFLECAPAVAEFDPIMVSEIQITIKEEDRLLSYDKMGQPITKLDISEIVVLGGVTK